MKTPQQISADILGTLSRNSGDTVSRITFSGKSAQIVYMRGKIGTDEQRQS